MMGEFFHQNPISSHKNMLQESIIIIIPGEISLVALVFKIFSNWGKSEIPPNAAAANPLMVMQSISSSAIYGI